MAGDGYFPARETLDRVVEVAKSRRGVRSVTASVRFRNASGGEKFFSDLAQRDFAAVVPALANQHAIAIAIEAIAAGDRVPIGI